MTQEPRHTTQELIIFIDGECPLCLREARMLQRRDRRRGRLRMIDITHPSFDPSRYGRTMDQVMGAIHGRLPDGTMITGMEVFRRAYAAVGLGWLLAPTGWPGLRQLFDRLYAWFARNRLRLTGRGNACTDRCRLQPRPVPVSRHRS
jgi:predicted DCC family thiol-disulfide oxidoreductase YuxK